MMKARDAEMAYRRAFDQFAGWVAHVQSLKANPNPDRQAIETALLQLNRAREEYHLRRDQWAHYLLRASRDSYESTQNDEDRLCTAAHR
jgi:hypothetical protein